MDDKDKTIEHQKAHIMYLQKCLKHMRNLHTEQIMCHVDLLIQNDDLQDELDEISGCTCADCSRDEGLGI